MVPPLIARVADRPNQPPLLVESQRGGGDAASSRRLSNRQIVRTPRHAHALDLGHQGVGAILVSVGASHDWAAGGYTHHAPGDIACLSTLPGWRLHVPGHPDEAEALLRDAAVRDEPTYLRLSDAANANPRSSDGGQLHVERQDGSAAVTVIAVGPMLDRVRKAVTGSRVNLLYASTVHPLDKRTLRAVAADTDIVLVEPYLAGTSTAAIAEALADRPRRILALGVRRRALRRYGVAAEHDAAHGLDVAGLRSSIGAFMRAASGGTT